MGAGAAAQPVNVARGQLFARAAFAGYEDVAIECRKALQLGAQHLHALAFAHQFACALCGVWRRERRGSRHGEAPQQLLRRKKAAVNIRPPSRAAPENRQFFGALDGQRAQSHTYRRKTLLDLLQREEPCIGFGRLGCQQYSGPW